MASSAASNTRVELQGTGDNAGTWGTKANTVFQIFDRVTSGYGSSVAVADGDTTLSVSDYTLATWHYQVWNVTGALTASANLIVPNYGKFWAVVNATTGSQTLTVKVTGQTGVVIPDGGWAILYNNGTDVAKLIDSDDYQVADADLTAIAALSSTGIAVRTASNTWAQRTLTGTSAEITVTNGDGVSGNPTLSLPTALTFTGKTVTGGTFSGPTLSGTISASGATFSDLGTVTTVDINGGTIDGVTIGGASAGAGTFTTLTANTSVSTPSVTNAGTLALAATGANVITISTNGSERARIDNSGNVAIGTSTADRLLTVYAAVDADQGMSIRNNSAGTGAAAYIQLGNDSDSQDGKIILTGSGNTSYAGARSVNFISNVGAFGFYRSRLSPTASMLIDSSGNVSVATAAASLYVGGTGAGLRLLDNGTNSQIIPAWGRGTGSLQLYDATGTLAVDVATTYTAFRVGGAEYARIDSSGRFGVGAVPSYLAHFAGVASGTTPVAYINRTNSAGGGAGIGLLIDMDEDSGGKFISFNDYDNTEQFYVTQGSVAGGTVYVQNKLGIGETSPDYKLDVNGTFGFTPGTSVTPVDNGDMTFYAPDNTTCTIAYKGTDGTVRTGNVTLS